MDSEKLPTSFDIVVLGTGLPESMVAASLSRIGKSVLHVDRNDYYGGQWATFNFDSLIKWVAVYCDKEVANNISNPEDFLKQIPSVDSTIRNIEIISFIPETNPPPPPVECRHEENVENRTRETCETETMNENSNPNEIIVLPSSDEGNAQIDRENTQTEQKSTQADEGKAQANERSTKTDERISQDDEGSTETDEGNTNVYKGNALTDEGNALTDEGNAQTDEGNAQADEETAQAEAEAQHQPDSQIEVTPRQHLNSTKQSSMVTQAKIKHNASDSTVEDLKILSRKFNLDITAKFLFSAGPLVNAILKANISHYSEFQIVNRILTCKNKEIIEVPCNRSDIFSSTFLTMIEKRTLMKFLTLCLDFDSDQPTEDLTDYLEVPFLDFLQSRRLSDNLQKFIIYSIAMVKPDTKTCEGMKETCSFLKSLGRYGKSPFIWPLYGVGELPQAFCRMSAVFGSLYCLSKPASSLHVENNQCTKVVLGEESIECKYVVMSHSYLPTQYINHDSKLQEVSKAILITDSSILPSDTESVSFLTIPPLEGKEELVRVIELGPSASACPSGLFVLYLSCVSTQTAVKDLEDYVKILTSATDDNESNKPKLLWSIYFNQIESIGYSTELPENLFVTQLPGSSLGFQNAVDNAEMIFKKICPDGEFLMAVPNAEDIVWDTEANSDENVEKSEKVESDKDDKFESETNEAVDCVAEGITNQKENENDCEES